MSKLPIRNLPAKVVNTLVLCTGTTSFNAVSNDEILYGCLTYITSQCAKIPLTIKGHPYHLYSSNELISLVAFVKLSLILSCHCVATCTQALSYSDNQFVTSHLSWQPADFRR